MFTLVQNINQVLVKFSFPINLTEGSFENLEFIFQKRKIAILYKNIDLKAFLLFGYHLLG